MKLRTLIKDLHIYLGLFCATFFIIYSVSALHFNHKFGWMNEGDETIEWTAQIKYPTQLTDKGEIAAAIRDSLGLFGNTPFWNQDMQDDYYKFEIQHIGNVFNLNVDKATGQVQITEKHRGAGYVFGRLHLLSHAVPSAPAIINSWPIFQEVTIFYLLFAMGSAIYFWSKKKKPRRTGFIVLGTLTLLFTLFFGYILLIG